jgi:HK97 family phage prohead protease
MVERIRPGAFDRAIREDDVRGLFNHDPNHVLGRSGPGTLRLSVDSKGLRYEIDPPDTQTGRDVVAMLARGDVSGSSFSFAPTRTTWEEERDAKGNVTYVRYLEEIAMFDVGPVTFPAYTSASSGVRDSAGEDSEGVRAELEAWKANGQAAADQDYAEAVSKSLDVL